MSISRNNVLLIKVFNHISSIRLEISLTSHLHVYEVSLCLSSLNICSLVLRELKVIIKIQALLFFISQFPASLLSQNLFFPLSLLLLSVIEVAWKIKVGITFYWFLCCNDCGGTVASCNTITFL